MINGWDKKELYDYCADKGIQWKFTTPGAPHQNGCAEALVKSCKRALKTAIGDHTLSPFELYTCIPEVANLVNQRPIGRVPNDPDDGSYLCPNDMLLGKHHLVYLKGHLKKPETPDGESNSCRRLLIPFGIVGREMYFRYFYRGKSGT
jgi:transposase InsO family protein